MQEDLKIVEKSIDKRGRPIKCKYCHGKFQLYGEEKIQWTNNKFICPLCGEQYCILPETEKELRLLQEQYIKHKDKKTFDKMIVLLYSYTESLIKKHFSNRLTFDGSLEYYAHNSITLFIEYYLKDPDFTVDVSFAGLLLHKIREAIFNKKEHASAQVSLDYTYEDGNKVEYVDNKKSVIDYVEEEDHKRNLCKILSELIFNAETYCSCKHENYSRLIATHLYLNSGSKHFDRFFQLYGSEGKNITFKTLEMIKKVLCSDDI